VAGKVDGIADGLCMASQAIDSGKVKQTLDALVSFTQGVSA